MDMYDRYVTDIDAWRRRAVRSGRAMAFAAGGLLILVMLFNGLYQVQPEEVGVVLRFGRYVRTTEPGLRAKIPFCGAGAQSVGATAAQGRVRVSYRRGRCEQPLQ